MVVKVYKGSFVFGMSDANREIRHVFHICSLNMLKWKPFYHKQNLPYEDNDRECRGRIDITVASQHKNVNVKSVFHEKEDIHTYFFLYCKWSGPALLQANPCLFRNYTFGGTWKLT